jgi:hypothetical protein
MGTGAGAGVAGCNAIVTVPAGIATDCSTNVTAQLNSFVATVPTGSIVELSADACYLVSNSPDSLFTLNGTKGITFNGNGATLEQNTYNGGSCSTDTIQPVLWLQANTNLTISNLTIKGPGGCGGAGTEGGYGIFMGNNPVGNSGVTMTGVHVENTTGDGLSIAPMLGSGTGINTNVIFTSGSLMNIGYHVLTLEGVNGLKFTDNAISRFGNFADLEVDTNCDYVNGLNECLAGPSGTPTSVAQWNVTISGNTFTNGNGTAAWIVSEQGQCIPQKNLDIESNRLDASVNADIVLRGANANCPTDVGLTVKNNISAAPSKSPCGGSIVAPPGCAIWEVEDYAAVTISGNTLRASDGQPGYFPNTPWVPCTAVAAVYGAQVSGNTCNNAFSVLDPSAEQFPPLPVANVGVTSCGDTYWLTQPVDSVAPAPKTDGVCA